MKHLLILLFVLCSGAASAQDVIVKKDGSTILSKVLEVGQSEIKHKKFDNQDGPTYTIKKSELQSINYQNGAKDTFSTTMREENRYLPNNQNDGVQRMNDMALLALDQASFTTPQSAKTLRLIGWIGGLAIIGGGVAFACTDDDNTPIGLGIAGGGALFTAGFLLAANYQINKARGSLSSTPLFKNDFKFDNGSSLSAGIDMLSDHTIGNNTLGLGLRYNF